MKGSREVKVNSMQSEWAVANYSQRVRQQRTRVEASFLFSDNKKQKKWQVVQSGPHNYPEINSERHGRR